MNANMNPGARIPRNAICIWQSDETIARLSGSELSTSLRLCFPNGDRFRPGFRGLDSKLVHPKDWPSATVIGDGSGFRSVPR